MNMSGEGVVRERLFLSVWHAAVVPAPDRGPERTHVASSAAVHEALSEIFDKRGESVVVVSGYDETILYANPAMAVSRARQGSQKAKALPVDFVGRSIRDVDELYGMVYPDTPIGRALTTDETVCEQTRGTAYWVCASILPLSDVSRTAISSVHRPDLSEQEARLQHSHILAQATVALEFAESERLIQVGMEALHRARQRIQSLKKTLLFSELTGQFPIE